MESKAAEQARLYKDANALTSLQYQQRVNPHIEPRPPDLDALVMMNAPQRAVQVNDRESYLRSSTNSGSIRTSNRAHLILMPW